MLEHRGHLTRLGTKISPNLRLLAKKLVFEVNVLATEDNVTRLLLILRVNQLSHRTLQDTDWMKASLTNVTANRLALRPIAYQTLLSLLAFVTKDDAKNMSKLVVFFLPVWQHQSLTMEAQAAANL